MIKALLKVRFRSLLTMFLQRGVKSKKKTIGTTILFSFLFLYLGAVMCGMSGVMFYTLSEPYHIMGLDWLYFAMAGISALGIAVIGSVFTTQNQIYEAKDNALLLSMPIPSPYILLSRMIPLLAMNLLFATIVMGPAIVVYNIWVSFDPLPLMIQILSIPVIALFAQAISCLLGWLFHLVSSRLNKSLASVLFMVVFLAGYYAVVYNANDILNSLIVNSDAFADILSTWVWPFYAMGNGCTGDILHWIGFAVIFCAVFAFAYYILSRTFLKAATLTQSARKERRLSLRTSQSQSPFKAIIRKELGKFIGTPVYLTNMGLGIVMVVALAVAGIVMKNKVLEIWSMMMLPDDTKPLIICAMLSFLASTMCISTPSVSLEGKNLWILKSMPVSAQQILNAKLSFHVLLTVPVSAVCGLALAITYGCDIVSCLLCAAIPALLAVLSGVMGMVCGINWAQFDYQNDTYPCKQSVSVLVSMFGMMGIPFGLGLLYIFALSDHMTATHFMFVALAALSAISAGFYYTMIHWGAKKWNSF